MCVKSAGSEQSLDGYIQEKNPLNMRKGKQPKRRFSLNPRTHFYLNWWCWSEVCLLFRWIKNCYVFSCWSPFERRWRAQSKFWHNSILFWNSLWTNARAHTHHTHGMCNKTKICSNSKSVWFDHEQMWQIFMAHIIWIDSLATISM